MTHAAGRALLVTAGILMGSCSSSRIPACPGDPIVTLPFHAELRAGEGGCVFGATVAAAESAGLRTSFDFTGIVATSSTGDALLCLERPEASPLRGTLAGDHLAVAGPGAAAFVNACTCGIGVAETLDGSLGTAPDGRTTFSGTLRDVLSVNEGVDPATCEPAPTATSPGPRCGVPCELHWTVTAAR